MLPFLKTKKAVATIMERRFDASTKDEDKGIPSLEVLIKFWKKNHKEKKRKKSKGVK